MPRQSNPKRVFFTMQNSGVQLHLRSLTPGEEANSQIGSRSLGAQFGS
jgi:hypothetical protein